MPTAEEFRAAADIFSDQADAIEDLPASLRARMGPDVLQGGVLTADVETLLDDAATDTAIDVATLGELAEECRWRAEQCDLAEARYDRYVADLAAHERALAQWRVDNPPSWEDELLQPMTLPPVAPVRPTPPHDWIEF